MAILLSPWSLWEAETWDSAAMSLSADLSTLTITDNDPSSRLCCVYQSNVMPGDVLEFEVEASCLSGTMHVSVQAGTLAPAVDAMGGGARDIKAVDDAGAGWKHYSMRCVVPYNQTEGCRATWFVGGTLAGMGSASFRFPKCSVNGMPVGTAGSFRPDAVKMGVALNYSTEILSRSIDFSHAADLTGSGELPGDPTLFPIGAYRQAKKFIGDSQSSATVAIAKYGTADDNGAGLRLFRSEAAGPDLPSSGVSDDSTVGFIDALYDSGTGHVRVGRINFFYQSGNSRVFSVTTIGTDGTEDVNGLYVWKSGDFSPKTDNAASCGTPAHRWSEVFAGTGTINTSDEREKASIAVPSDALMRAWGKVNFKIFQFKDAIQKKGADAARIHVGVIAQQVIAAFAEEGLDATRYGLLCHDSWDAEEPKIQRHWIEDEMERRDDDGNLIAEARGHYEELVEDPGREAGDIYSIRYDEALALECAYQRWRLEQIEARLNAVGRPA